MKTGLVSGLVHVFSKTYLKNNYGLSFRPWKCRDR